MMSQRLCRWANLFPEGVARPGWYQPTDRGVERRLGERLTWLRSLDDATPLSPYT